MNLGATTVNKILYPRIYGVCQLLFSLCDDIHEKEIEECKEGKEGRTDGQTDFFGSQFESRV